MLQIKYKVRRVDFVLGKVGKPSYLALGRYESYYPQGCILTCDRNRILNVWVSHILMASMNKTIKSSIRQPKGRKSQVNFQASTSKHHCDRDDDLFCYVCSEFYPSKTLRTISEHIMTIYKDCSDLRIAEQNKECVPHKICENCRSHLKIWLNSKNIEDLKLKSTTLWAEPTREEDCYCCKNDVTVFNGKNRKNIAYVDVPTVIGPSKICKKDKQDIGKIECISSLESLRSKKTLVKKNTPLKLTLMTNM